MILIYDISMEAIV
uniref:Uncharacterized protein n=1 Tax=Anguilla anguilla TaxID=7936 RepID=A0A0E9SCT1_ANGAN